MRKVPVLLSLAMPMALLAACGSEQSGTVTDAEGNETDYASDRDGSDTAIRITGEDGEEAVISSGSDAGADLPSGFTVYPGANVVSRSNIATNDGKGSVLYLTTSASPTEVAAFYRRQAEAAGIAIAVQTTTATSQMLAGEGPEGKSFTMTASVTDEGTGVNLMIGEKP